MLSRQQLETEISRLVAEQPNIFSLEMAQIINNRYGTNYSSNNIANISNELEKISKETLIAIFYEFQRYETDFATISQRTGVSQARIRKEILKVMVNNIYRVCIIVRKRSISKLVKNFLSQKSIHSLAMLIVKPSNFRSVKTEYSLLWNFIARFHEQSFFKTVTDENYKLIYRELIILAEAYKVSEDFEDNGGALGFERITLQQRGMNDPFALLRDFKKKNCQQTIDLISDDDQQLVGAGEIQEDKRVEIELEQHNNQRENNEPLSNIMAILEKPVERAELQGQRFLAELVILYSRMSELELQSKQGKQNLNDEMAQIALKICTIEFLIGVN